MPNTMKAPDLTISTLPANKIAGLPSLAEDALMEIPGVQTQNKIWQAEFNKGVLVTPNATACDSQTLEHFIQDLVPVMGLLRTVLRDPACQALFLSYIAPPRLFIEGQNEFLPSFGISHPLWPLPAHDIR